MNFLCGVFNEAPSSNPELKSAPVGSSTPKSLPYWKVLGTLSLNLILAGPKPKEIQVETFRIDYLIRTPKVEKLSLQPIRIAFTTQLRTRYLHVGT